ncbi:TPA: hypothetical protein DEP34_04835 [Candidatus Uhrbacteria bacterium]|uniref:DUF362 domain-containing protein n=2 Tax=Candidatus Uhriibacteriota TaxID=1752732 RepID=A0A0G1Q727_9BACT|nr:MAG: hypothetical protein UX45_C0006G0028 [Candidatus Uhrbacteria bacterium GW2011_GWF2_46_218]KKU40861.1 MAG: hypothetical protein UX57_C0009G0028 [Candidatus Uhrbacteria bacterium GW2011_GWE2_46_68]HBK33906.1 hypothetical protein [Candidatus Uhrbacteria bacterium]HCB19669.1 hypothetical protein [Candidatus Uhrbacteria bacterium]
MVFVALHKGIQRRTNIVQVLRLLPPESWQNLEQAKTVLIKINLVHHLFQLASTHVDAVRGVLDFFRPKTQAKIFIGDASYHGTKAAFRHFGYERLLEEYPGVVLVDLNDDETVEGWGIKQDGTRTPLRISKIAAEADVRLNLAVMKTHRDTGVSLGMKNWAAGIIIVPPSHTASGRKWARVDYLHHQGSQARDATLAEIFHTFSPSLTIIDAWDAMEGDGPTRGTLVETRFALAGVDTIAVDTIGCRLMNIHPGDIGHLAIAAQAGYGEGDQKQITILGTQDISSLIYPFAHP